MYFIFSKTLAPFLDVSNLLVFLLIIFYFFRKKNKIFYFLLSLFIIISFIPLGSIFEYHFLSKKFYNQNNSKDYDSILILGGGDDRIFQALKLYKEKPDSKIVFSGGSYLIESKEDSYEIQNFIYLTKNLINEKDLIVLKKSSNSIENIQNFINENKKLNFKKTILVTSPYHYKRVIEISKKLNFNLLVYYWPMSKQSKSLLNYYQNISVSNNLNAFNRFVRELLGILSVKLFI